MVKQKILDVLNKHKWEVTETWLTNDIITEKNFNDVAEDLAKLFVVPQLDMLFAFNTWRKANEHKYKTLNEKQMISIYLKSILKI